MSLMVGISGIRGIIGKTLTPSVVLDFAQAYGTLLGGGRVVLGRDTRPSGEMYAAILCAGLTAAGSEVTDLGIAMTPTVGHAILAGKYDGGVVVTASHNPSQWNGLKFLDERGLAPDPARARKIASIRDERAFRLATGRLPTARRDDSAGAAHVAAVLEAREVDLGALRGTRVVLDSVNGAGCLHSPGMLAALGCEVKHLNDEPHGEFAHTPEPTPENLTSLCEAVRQERAAIGFAQDPDADRLAIVDEHGTAIGEEYTLALAAWSVLSRRPGAVAANLSTSRLIDVVAERHSCEVIRSPVGEANVANAMLEQGCVIGGEGNGGLIDPRISWVRDSLSAMSLVLQLMAATGKRVSELVAALPRFAMVKQKIECDSRERIDAAAAAAAEKFVDERINTDDGTRVDFPQGWVHLRASNTEPIVRVIAEAESTGTAEELIRRVRAAADL